MITPKELNARLVSEVENICQSLLPKGKRMGGNWCVGGVTGEEGDSCRIQLTGSKAGYWADFASNDKGDLLTLYSKAKGVSLKDAIVWAKEYLGIRDCAQDFHRSTKAIALKKILPHAITDQVSEWFYKRKITTDVLTKYKVTSSGTVVNFPYYKNGELFFVKYRDIAKPKEASMHVEPNGTQILFGWQAIPEDARAVVITEGEPDALAYASIGIPALSVPVGGGSGNKQENWIQNDFDRLEQFDEIFLSLDMDKQGQEAVNAILPRLGHHRCRVVTLPHKDANDCLMQGVNLRKCLADAKHRDPEELKCATDFLPDVHKAFSGSQDIDGDYLPWLKASEQFRLRPGEVTIWQGINGHGKSMVLSHVIANLILNEIKTCTASMEMRPVQQLKRLYQQISACESPAPDYIEKINANSMQFCYLVNIHGTAKADRLLELFEYAVLRFGCTHFVVDSLAKCGMDEDDYNAQKSFVERLGDFAHKTMAHVHLVAHARKLQNEMDMPGKMDVKGTGALTDMVDNLVSVWRNKTKEERIEKILASIPPAPIPIELSEQPDCLCCVQKQRNYDWEGKIALWYDKRSHQYLEKPTEKAEAML